MRNLSHIIRLALVTATAMMPLLVQAQSDDLGMWLGVSAEKQLGKGWSAEVEGEWRMKDNISATDRLSIGMTANYKFNKWLKASAGYELMDCRNEGGLTESGNYYNSTCWYLRHRLSAALTGTWKAGRWKFSLRERWVYTYTPSYERHRMSMNETSANYGTISDKVKNGKAKNVLRSRLSAEYNIPNCHFTPYGSAEIYNAWDIQKIRYTLGTEYKFNKQHSIKLYYLFQDRKSEDEDESVQDQHVIGASYNFKF